MHGIGLVLPNEKFILSRYMPAYRPGSGGRGQFLSRLWVAQMLQSATANLLLRIILWVLSQSLRLLVIRNRPGFRESPTRRDIHSALVRRVHPVTMAPYGLCHIRHLIWCVPALLRWQSGPLHSHATRPRLPPRAPPWELVATGLKRGSRGQSLIHELIKWILCLKLFCMITL